MNTCGYTLGQKGIITFRILSDGRLKQVGTTRIESNSSQGGLLAVDASGRWLCIAPEFVPEVVSLDNPGKPWRKTTLLTFFALDNQGLPVYQAHITVPVTAIQLVLCPTGKRLYVNGGNAITTVDLAQNAMPFVRSTLHFSELYWFTTRAGFRNQTHLTVSPDGRYVFSYIETGFMDHAENWLQIFHRNRQGELEKQSKEPLVSTSPTDVRHAGATWVLSDGQTVVMNGHPEYHLHCGLWKAGKFRSLNLFDEKSNACGLDPLGRVLIATSKYDKAYSAVYRRIAPGKLKRVATYRNVMGELAIEPQGRFLYSQGNGTLKTWRISPDCSLTPFREEPWPLEHGVLKFPAR